jgi:hypothetical protein
MKKNKRYKILCSCLILSVLFALTAQAATITVENDPGPVGGPAGPLAGWSINDPDIDIVNLVFTDNKALKSGPGVLIFLLGGGTNEPYAGFFLDASGSAIPGTEFFGQVDVDAANVDLAAPTVWSGMRFISSTTFELGAYAPLLWISAPPTVVPVPAAVWLFGSGLIGLVAIRRRFKK